MYIKNILKNKPVSLSLEVFPPKTSAGLDSVKSVLDAMCALPIDYVSVTYGAGGSNSKNTNALADHLKNGLGTEALAHLTCIGVSKDDIRASLEELRSTGIENILALRGDKPAGSDMAAGDYAHASDLTAAIKEFGGFCVGGACYPECHPDSKDFDDDIEGLKKKAAAGCDFLVTQMFFDNGVFYDFRDKAVSKGINIPIIAGIMPLTNINQIERMCVLSGGATMPSGFTKIIAKFADNPAALKQAGITYAINQITDLIANDVSGIHIYTMNRPDVAAKIVDYVEALVR